MIDKCEVYRYKFKPDNISSKLIKELGLSGEACAPYTISMG